MIAKLERRQYAPVVGAMAAIVEQRNVPVRTQRVEEAQQRARRFREFEAVEAFLQRMRRTPADHIAHMQLRHFVVGEIHYAVAAIVEHLQNFFALFETTAQAHADKDAGVFGIGKTVVELGDRAPAKQLAELQEAALLFRDGYRQQRFTLFAQFATFRDVAQAVKVHVSTGKNMRQPFAANVVLGDIFFHSRQCQRARGFRHRAHIFEQVFHRRTYGIAIDGDDVVEILLA